MIKKSERPSPKDSDYIPRCPAERYEDVKRGYVCWIKDKLCTERGKENLRGCAEYTQRIFPGRGVINSA